MIVEGDAQEVLSRVVGAAVANRQLVANSVNIDLRSSLDPSQRWTVWLEPTWHLVGPEGLVTGSRQAQDDVNPSGFEAASKALDIIVGLEVVVIEKDHCTGDLILELSGGYSLRTFAVDPRDDMLWSIRVWSTGQELVGRPRAHGRR